MLAAGNEGDFPRGQGPRSAIVQDANRMSQILKNLLKIRERISAAALKSGRASGAITLVAVTKSVGAAEINLLRSAGCSDFGESRPQDLWTKAEELTVPRETTRVANYSSTLAVSPIRWHMIGHVQTNKVARTLPLLTLLHSLDRWSLVEAIQKAELSEGKRVPVLIEVNISGDADKLGFKPEHIEPLLAKLVGQTRLEIRGLMGMSGLKSDADQTRREFAALRALRDRLRPNCPEGSSLTELSMGMSGDYEIGIEEGATMIRIGSALFA